MKISRIPIAFVCIIGYFIGTLACKDQVNSPYQGCCEIDPIVANVSGATLYVPNAFTPNGDGINDVFSPLSGKEVATITAFSVSTLTGIQLHFVENGTPNFTHEIGWDGVDQDGKVYDGKFNFEVTIETTSGMTETFRSEACSISCETENIEISDLTNCFLSVQHDGDGGLAKNTPTLETCF